MVEILKITVQKKKYDLPLILPDSLFYIFFFLKSSVYKLFDLLKTTRQSQGCRKTTQASLFKLAEFQTFQSGPMRTEKSRNRKKHISMAHKAFMLLSIHHMMGKRPGDFITAFRTFKWSWESWVVTQLSNSNLGWFACRSMNEQSK